MSWWGSNGTPQPVVYPELPSPVTKEDFERLADECYAQLMQLNAEGPQDGWNRVDFEATNGEEEVKIWDKTLAGTPVNCLKTEAAMPCSAKNLFDLLCEEDLARRQEYEKDCSCYEIVRQVTPEISITRARYKAPFPVTSREVVAIRVRRRLPGGGYVSFGKSINCDECLTDSSHIRAALHLVGAICRPIPGQPNRCMLTRIAQLDPKGNIPTMVVNATKKKGGSSMILLRKVIRNRNLPPAVEDEIEEPAAPVIAGLPQQTKDFATEVKEELPPKQIEARSEAGPVGVQREEAQTHTATSSGKGKERESRTAPIMVEGDEVFYEAATSLPWDERPLRQMYDQHRDEVSTLVSSLQASLSRLENIAQSNEQRLQSLERLIADMDKRNASHQPTGTLNLTNLSWSSIALLAVWPVVAYSVYDFVTSRRPPRK